MTDLLIKGAAEVLTCAADAPDLIGRIPGGSVAVTGGRIERVGVFDCPADHVLDAAGGVVMPGFVDCHTHVVFAGGRAEEYTARCAGLAPPPGATVGITGTAAATRAASVDELVAAALPRLRAMAAHGTTTAESKTGYGLSPDSELRLLEANRRLDALLPLDLVSTYLGAHAVPPGTDPDRYTDEVVDQLPAVAGLAEFCDVYCDEGYFTLRQTERILRAGLEAGLRPKLHLDAYSHTGAASLAVDLGAASVDHLNHSTPEDLELLAAAGIPAVYVPLLDLAAAHSRPFNPRAAADLHLALATDFCPGCWSPSMPLAIALACRVGGLTAAQAIRAATLGGAAALSRADTIGSLEPGKAADLLVLDLPSHVDLAYRLGVNPVAHVLKNGT